MTRLLSAVALLTLAPVAFAQTAAPQDAAAVPDTPSAVQVARLDLAAPSFSSSDSSATLLPDAPSVPSAAIPTTTFEGQAALNSNVAPTAPRYATIILAGQNAVPLHGMEKAAYGVRDAFSLQQLVSITTAAGWSHLIDSAPHYGTNSEAFGKREGVAALRSTIQIISTDAVFSPMFHDDPRYYAMGRGRPFFKRAVYAATRVVVVRSSHSTDNRLNAPLLLGYGVAAAANNAYYPDRDRGAKQTFQNYATSLGGAALGFEVSEFLDDALRLVHLRR